MSLRRSTLLPAAESAAETLGAAGRRWEVLLRQGRSLALRWWAGGREERASAESGVACRVSVAGRSGFAAASGSGARAGRRAAESALEALLPGIDAIPPAGVLGTTPVPAPPEAATLEHLHAVAASQQQALARHPGVELVELRATSGEAHTHLFTAEGHAAEARIAGVAVELVLAAAAGPARLVHWAGHSLDDLDVAEFAERSAEAVLVCSRGGPASRRLADVVLAPPAAAPLVLALVERLQRAGVDPADPLHGARVAPAWRLVDERSGPEGLLPQPFDGEGLPSRPHALLAEGRLGTPLLAWGEAAPQGRAAGGAVRHSYRQAPRGGPANLVVHPARPLAPQTLLERLEDGFWIDLPAGPVQVDPSGERFTLRAAAVKVAAGRPIGCHPVVEVRGSFRRLLGGLAATGLDTRSFSLGAAVTTPSLLLRALEVA
ncbi:MAG TPA: metallopeptidase TldD-related protein [Thermoanaerobaculaceae bacterium]|nr:metallopeptidase TldD-related protein [Thermoanaerobaculaceae bacterium]HRS14698.1 metallopeptidase TldD-related protein [Thermoanaerobaculaceae bacterium]